jgi:ferredoxin
MSVEIKFTPGGLSGVFDEGISVAEAAQRVGFRIPDCGAWDSGCAILIVAGGTLLSDLTDKERALLSPERLANGERLACQCNAARAGELVIRLAVDSESTRAGEQKTRDLRQEFRELSFESKISTLMQLETIAMTQAFDKITDASISLGKKIFDSVMPDDSAKVDSGGTAEKEKTV